MRKHTRISYNSANWQKPTGEARKQEANGTYNNEHGFGHEDWLFRNEWLIDGWRYAFIQGVNKSYSQLIKEKRPFDLTLFTIQPDKQRRYVARIDAVECLDELQARDAVEIFKEYGWHKRMLEEINEAGGNPDALGDQQWAKEILNVRFRLENVHPFSPETFASEDSPIYQLNRYQLYSLQEDDTSIGVAAEVRKPGSTSLPTFETYTRKGSQATICTPEHAKMQKKLMLELREEYPFAEVSRERDFVDVRVETQTELILFEIKSDLEPRTVIRRALGQILEYAFHPRLTHRLPVRLVIVGRQQPSSLDEAYLEHLQSRFSLPISYRKVEI